MSNQDKWFKVLCVNSCLAIMKGEKYLAKKDGDCRFWIKELNGVNMGSFHVDNFVKLDEGE